MEIFLANDHAAVSLKEGLLKSSSNKGFDVHDLTPSAHPAEHYSEAADRICQKILQQKNEKLQDKTFGILLCGTGQGTNMRANRYNGIRAALVTNVYQAEMARKHNDANVLVLGARVTTQELAEQFLDVFIHTEFEGGRHIPRIAAIDTPIQK